MTIIEAMKSGKRFKHRSWEGGYTNYSPEKIIHCEMSDILSDRWVVEEETIELTLSQLKRAIMNSCAYREDAHGMTFKVICEELLFEELKFT